MSSGLLQLFPRGDGEPRKAGQQAHASVQASKLPPKVCADSSERKADGVRGHRGVHGEPPPVLSQVPSDGSIGHTELPSKSSTPRRSGTRRRLGKDPKEQAGPEKRRQRVGGFQQGPG